MKSAIRQVTRRIGFDIVRVHSEHEDPSLDLYRAMYRDEVLARKPF